MSMSLPAGRASELRGPTVLRVILGSQLRQFREDAGVTSEQAGHQIRASRAKISRMEHGRVAVKDRDLADLLTFYGITNETVQSSLLSIAQQARTPDWWSRYGDILPPHPRAPVRAWPVPDRRLRPRCDPARAQNRAARGDRSPGKPVTQAPGRAHQPEPAPRVVGRG